MHDKFQHLVKRHPCFNQDGHQKTGRIHLPVSPTCNILCRFCNRCRNDYEDRPGVARGILKPEDAVATVRKALELCPEITVAGIAGPGDTLASDHALRTFELLREPFPKLIFCLSTNGLQLLPNVERIVSLDIATITVTVNAVDSVILEKINAGIILNGKRISGIESAEILIDAQLKGIREAADAGLTVKINTVLVPGVNDGHVEDIARATRSAGAQMINILPLIPQNGFIESLLKHLNRNLIDC